MARSSAGMSVEGLPPQVRGTRAVPWQPLRNLSVGTRSFDVFNDDDILGSFSRY
jgi:hypothetical protein